VLFAQLVRLRDESPAVAAAVRAEVAALDADVDELDALLDRQNFRLAFWRTAGEELDYRRFFDITTLAGLRVEAPEVFIDTHRLVLSWVADGEVDGLRIDHPDGLRDPARYFDMLRAAAPDAWIVIEKILEPGESLPGHWPVEGTTGYDFCASVTRLLHDERGLTSIREHHDVVVGEVTDLAEVEHAAKVAVMETSLASDVARVLNLLAAVAEQHRRFRDHTRQELRAALVEVAAAHDVYRTYVVPDGAASPADVATIARALEAAAARRDDLDPDLFDFVGQILRGELDDGSEAAVELRQRFQQLTGPVMAKGVEDTVLYDVVPLVSLNEVGADPSGGGLGVADFHAEMAVRAERAPRSMLTLSTHDTKRSEDVRARLAVLSEMPGAWNDLVDRFRDGLDVHRGTVDVPGWPDPRMELLLLQSLVGAHPLGVERAVAYMEKAAKEAKRHTSWVDPVPAYDAALRNLVSAVCADVTLMAMVESFVDDVVVPGRVNSLAQKLVCLTAPGVPDVYQGTEVWDLSLVDPDNRRPVDHRGHRRLLEKARAMTPEERWSAADDGTPKLWTVHRALSVRRSHPGWFADSPYRHLPVDGPAASHVVAFLRGDDVAVVVPRLPVGFAAGGGWYDTRIELPTGSWWDELGEQENPGGTIEVGALLGRFPVALLHTDVASSEGGGR
jgi:(1->4)-alpha-D-glucan 1-alpha-D-glucosylmutase